MLVLTWIADLFRNLVLTNVVSKDTLIVYQIDFIAFIGKVINLTAFVERTAKLWKQQNSFLGVTDVTVAIIVEMLTPNDGMMIVSHGFCYPSVERQKPCSQRSGVLRNMY